MPTVTTVDELKINKLTKAQYDEAVQAGTIGENEISIITDLDVTAQTKEMPESTEENLGEIIQFVGETTASYINGYFYKCVSDGQSPATYSWEQVDVQPGGGLPDQTGNAGKFLTTDGTDASWGDALANQATGTGAIGIGAIHTVSGQNSIGIGFNARVTRDNATAIGGGAYAGGKGVVKVGSGSAYGENSLGLGRNTYISNGCVSGIAIGCDAGVGASNAIQISSRNYGGGPNVVNSDANTFKVANANGNYEMMSADGTIPTDRLTKVNSTITLTAAGWSSNTQTVNVTGMTATGVVLVSPDSTDQADYTSAGILCTAQAAGTLTFTCDTVPSTDIDVNVVML